MMWQYIIPAASAVVVAVVEAVAAAMTSPETGARAKTGRWQAFRS